MRRSFDLRQKKVIDVDTAEMVGYIKDVDIDFESGKINAITIPERGFLGIIFAKKTYTVPWESIIAIGNEYIIVKKEDKSLKRD